MYISQVGQTVCNALGAQRCRISTQWTRVDLTEARDDSKRATRVLQQVRPDAGWTICSLIEHLIYDFVFILLAAFGPGGSRRALWIHRWTWRSSALPSQFVIDWITTSLSVEAPWKHPGSTLEAPWKHLSRIPFEHQYPGRKSLQGAPQILVQTEIEQRHNMSCCVLSVLISSCHLSVLVWILHEYSLKILKWKVARRLSTEVPTFLTRDRNMLAKCNIATSCKIWLRSLQSLRIWRFYFRKVMVELCCGRYLCHCKSRVALLGISWDILALRT